MEQRVLITGISGQVGSFLADYLLAKDYKIYGMIRRSATDSLQNIDHIKSRIELVDGDLTDQSSLSRLVKTIRPHEIYNMGAQSFVAASFDQPITTADITGMGVLRLLEAIRDSGFNSHFLQASTSEMFGRVQETPQTEKTPFYPRSPYGCSKAFGHYITVNYRESYNLFACSAIMFNNEGPRRGEQFVTRKITKGVAAIAAGKATYIELGNTDAQRDWSYTGDIVDGLYKIMHHIEPDTFILASGETHSVNDFAQAAFEAAGISNPEQYIKINPRFLRPAEVDYLRGDSTKARDILGWKPQVGFKELVKLMVNADLAALKEK